MPLETVDYFLPKDSSWTVVRTAQIVGTVPDVAVGMDAHPRAGIRATSGGPGLTGYRRCNERGKHLNAPSAKPSYALYIRL